MSTLSRGDDRRAAPYDIDRADSGGIGLYVTDEVFLYRVVGVTMSDTGDMIDLEDCYSLDIARVPVDALHARRLRVVTAPVLPGP
jgi:hypothetical protein